jgi:integrase/recombinase XerC
MVVSDRSIDSFINYLQHEKRFSEHTVLAYRTDISQFYNFLRDQNDDTIDLIDVSYQDVRAWVVELMLGALNARTVNRKISTLRSFYNFLKRKAVVSVNPTAKIRAPKIGKRLPNYLKETEIDNLFTEIEFSDDWEGKRNLLIMRLLYECGLRRAELINLKLNDIDLEEGLIKVMGKGSKERLLPISKDLSSSLSYFINLEREVGIEPVEGNYLFLTSKGQQLYPKLVYNTVVKYLSQVTTLEQKSPHVLRHSFATHLTNAGAEIKAIKDLLGHSSLAATQVYTHNSIEKLKKSYKGAHPRA